MSLAQERGVPTMAYAIGAGPLRNSEDRRVVRDAVGAMEAVTVRDVETKRLLEEVGVERDIVVTADPALLLTPQPFPEDALVKEGVSTERRLVAMSVRERGGAAPALEHSPYHAILAAAADFVIERFEADVVFVPMERGDIRESHRVMAEMAAPERASVLDGRYGPRQLLGFMGHIELALGMMLHFLILAALAGVPLLALPYASKVGQFLEALGTPGPSAQPEHVGPLLAAIDRLWDDRDRCRGLMAEAVPRLQDQARQTAEVLEKLLAPG